MPRHEAVSADDVYLHDILARAARSYGDDVALRWDRGQLTYGELDRASDNLAHALRECGLSVGDRVALIGANSHEWIAVAFAISKVGAAMVLCNPSWTEVELERAFALTSPAAIIADADAIPRIPAHRQIGMTATLFMDGPSVPGWEPVAALVEGLGQNRARELGSPQSQEIALPFSSGTTGMPKAVRHSHVSLTAGSKVFRAVTGLSHSDRLQLYMPLFHIYGLATLCAGVEAGVPFRLFRRFDPERILTNIEQERVTILLGAGPIAQALLSCPQVERVDLSSLRYFLWGATPVAEATARRIRAVLGVNVLQGYGTTEVPSIACNVAGDPRSWRLDSVGLPSPGVELRVVDGDSRDPLPTGTAGEVTVKSRQTMLGYLPESATRDAFDDGWYRTGDIGWVDRDGWLHLSDRAKDMIKVNAFAVAPAEVEATLLGHPAVRDCAVYGIAEPTAGEAPVAAVVFEDGAEVSEEDLFGFARERLARYKWPQSIIHVDAIPRNASGKVLRRVLREAHPTKGVS